MAIRTDQAYIAVKPDGYVDGACFTESADAQGWCREMAGAGFAVKVCDRARAKQVLFEYLTGTEMAALADAVLQPRIASDDSTRVVVRGPIVGRYRDSDIPDWIETGDGARHQYVGTTGVIVDLSSLADGQSVIAPGLIYQRV